MSDSTNHKGWEVQVHQLPKGWCPVSLPLEAKADAARMMHVLELIASAFEMNGRKKIELRVYEAVKENGS